MLKLMVLLALGVAGFVVVKKLRSGDEFADEDDFYSSTAS